MGKDTILLSADTSSARFSAALLKEDVLLDEFESFDNITLRTYERKDRYALIRDGEELFVAVIGNSENNHLSFYTKDSKHIRLLSPLITESWIQSRKV